MKLLSTGDTEREILSVGGMILAMGRSKTFTVVVQRLGTNACDGKEAVNEGKLKDYGKDSAGRCHNVVERQTGVCALRKCSAKNPSQEREFAIPFVEPRGASKPRK